MNEINKYPIERSDLHCYYNNLLHCQEDYNAQNYLPRNHQIGSFGEFRGDRIHCGLDIYANLYAAVYSILSGIVIDVGEFTSKKICKYWNKTNYVVIESSEHNIALKYAELGNINVSVGDSISPHQAIGTIGKVLELDKITDDSPSYIKVLKSHGIESMLHLELHKMPYAPIERYRGGNYFGKELPAQLIDPLELLLSRKYFTIESVEKVKHKQFFK